MYSTTFASAIALPRASHLSKPALHLWASALLLNLSLNLSLSQNPPHPPSNPIATVSWPEWRGSSGQGHSSAPNVPTHWNETQNVSWKTSIPGRGWSSPVIDPSGIWLTTALESPANPADTARRLKSNTGDQPLTLLDRVEFHAVCVDPTSGRILRNVTLFDEHEPQWVHRLNSYATPTPILEPDRLYAHFGASGTVCLDTSTGLLLWKNQDLKIQHENGPGSSPVLWRDRLIVHMDGSDHQFIMALDKHTGKLAWKTHRSGVMNSHPQLKKSYATPLVVSINGKDQLISQGADWLYAYDPASGSELWKLKYGNTGFSLAARPVVGHGMIFLSTGFMRPELLAIRLPSATLKQPEIVWRYAKGVPTMASPLLVGNELYFVSDSGGMLSCLDALSGAELYRERLGGEHNASLLHINGTIHIPSREGVTSVIQAGRSFNLISKNPLDGRIMASQAVAHNALFMRTDTALYRIENHPSNPSP